MRRKAPAAGAAPDHVITIADEAFGRFDVEVLPPPEGATHAREFATHREAYGYASGLRMVTSWPVRDLSAGASS